MYVCLCVCVCGMHVVLRSPSYRLGNAYRGLSSLTKDTNQFSDRAGTSDFQWLGPNKCSIILLFKYGDNFALEVKSPLLICSWGVQVNAIFC